MVEGDIVIPLKDVCPALKRVDTVAAVSIFSGHTHGVAPCDVRAERKNTYPDVRAEISPKFDGNVETMGFVIVICGGCELLPKGFRSETEKKLK
jgi:hypothetical protein